MSALITLLLLSLSVFAEECDDFNLIDENLIQMGQHFNWNAATTANVAGAPCKAKSLPAPERINAAIGLTGTSSGDVNGVQFENESPELMSAFRDLTTMKNFFGSKLLPDEQVNLQATLGINPSCRKVICAAEKIWGPGLGKKILFLKLVYGFNASEYSISSAKRMKEAEMNDVLLALGDLPPHLKKIASPNQQLIRMNRDPLDSDGRTEANAMMKLYDSWSRNPSVKRQYVVFHELSHNISRKLGDLDSSPEWLKLSGWQKLGHDWEAGENHCRVSNYGSTNPDEDFAETASAYRYNAVSLKTQCPEKYEWMKARVFDNYEYLDSSCPK